MENWLQDYLPATIEILIELWIILLIAVLVFIRKFAILSRQYKKMTNSQGVEQLDQVIHRIRDQLKQLTVKTEAIESVSLQITKTVSAMKGKVGVLRYSAFAGQGSDLSFSVALVNEHVDGVVISGIHNRDESYIYAKSLEQGESKYTLSPEEREAINLAIKQG